MEPYAGNSVGHIRLQPGEVIEVVGSTDCGLLEGYVRGTNRSGFFPADCVQEVNIRQKTITNVSTASLYQSSPPPPPPSQSVTVNTINHHSNLNNNQSTFMNGQFNSSTAPRIKKTYVNNFTFLKIVIIYVT